MRPLAWALEILILTAGIHLFLRFVRTTRGSRLIRGLFVSVVLGVFVLWGLSRTLELEELEHLLQSSVGFVVILFAIVFQPELRRGIAQIGEHSLLGRLVKAAGADTVRRVVRAANGMSVQRHGALIAFERETSLSAYAETGTAIDATVSQRLIESLFQPKGSLHDGAVIIRKNRIVAAGTFFPLPQEGDIDRSLGTRHRAALGLSEETDAVVLVVSEETGSISLAKEGRIQTALSPDQVEAQLRELLERRPGRAATESPGSGAGSRSGADLVWLLASVLLACGILYGAHQDIRITRDFPLQVTGASASSGSEAEPGELLVVLPEEDHRLRIAPGRTPLRVAVSGSRSQLERLEGGVAGVFEVPTSDWGGGPVPVGAVDWKVAEVGLGFRWTEEGPPVIEIERFGATRIALDVSALALDDSRLNPRYEVRREAILLRPDTVEVVGPRHLLPALGTEIPFRLENAALSPEDRGERRFTLGLSAELRELGFSLGGASAVEARVPIAPGRREIGLVTREVALSCMAADRFAELSLWQLPAHAQTARFSIHTSGLIPVNADPGSPALVELLSTIRRYVEENLLVFVDIAELPPRGEGRSLPVRWTWRKNWRESPEVFGIERGTLSGREELRVELESDAEILLEPRAQTRDAGEPADETSSTGE